MKNVFLYFFTINLIVSGNLCYAEDLPVITVIGEKTVIPINDYHTIDASSATLTTTPLTELPQIVTVIPRKLIDDQQNISISESLRNGSNITPNNDFQAPNGPQTLIRGVRAERLVDGLTEFNAAGDRDSIVNVERIEILKGANGVLFAGGSGSSPGGLINVISKMPHAKAEYSTGLRLGSNEFVQPFFDLNHPLTEQILLRVTGEYTHARSQIDVIETERFNINPTLTLTNNDSTSLTLQGRVSRFHQPDYQGLPVAGTLNGNFRIDKNLFIGNRNIEDSRSEVTSIGATLKHRFNETWSTNIKSRYVEDETELNSQLIAGAGSNLFASEPFTAPSTFLLTDVAFFQETQEFSIVATATAKFNTKQSENTLLLGLDYSQINGEGFLNAANINVIDLANTNFPVAFNKPGTGVNDSISNNSTNGIFVQLQSNWFDRLHLLFALRLGSVDIEFKSPVSNNQKVSTRDTKLLPRLGAVFDINDQLSLFSSYSEGLRGQPLVFFADEPKPESSKQIETGLKFNLTGRFSGQLAYFRLERENFALIDPNRIGQAITTTAQESTGFEAELLWQSDYGFSVSANYAYTNATFSKSVANLAKPGDPIPGVPKHSGRLWLNYNFENTQLNGLRVGTGVFLQSGTTVFPGSTFTTDFFHTIDASIEYKTSHFRIGATIKNLTDKDNFKQIDAVGGRLAPQLERSVFVILGVNYN
ncbi:MAG: TonB-dependent siderophore receptor [Pseudomonadota bacterium]